MDSLAQAPTILADPLDAFEDRVHIAVNYFSKNFPAQAGAFRDRAKQYRDDLGAGCLVRDDNGKGDIGFVQGDKPDFVLTLLALPKWMTVKYFGIESGHHGKAPCRDWETDPKYVARFWRAARAFRASKYEGVTQQSKR